MSNTVTKRILRKRDTVPGPQWEALIPETGARIAAITRAQLIPKVAAHLRANDLPPMLEPGEDVDDYICAALSPEDQARKCKFVAVGAVPEQVQSGISDMAGFVQFVLDNGFSFVSPEEAERRAGICSQCPYLAPVSGCGACGIMRALLDNTTRVLGGRTTSLDNTLGRKACGLCGCGIRVKVHMNIDKPYRRAVMPDWCWQKETSL